MVAGCGGCSERIFASQHGKLATGQLASYNQHHMPRHRADGEGRSHSKRGAVHHIFPGLPVAWAVVTYIKMTEESCMKKVVLASFLACAAIASGLPIASAQDASPAPAAAQPGGGIQMGPDEYPVYNNAWTMPQTNATEMTAKAAALEA